MFENNKYNFVGKIINTVITSITALIIIQSVFSATLLSQIKYICNTTVFDLWVNFYLIRFYVCKVGI